MSLKKLKYVIALAIILVCIVGITRRSITPMAQHHHYPYDSVLVVCMDGMYDEAVSAYFRHDLALKPDRVQLAGGAVNIANGDARGKAMLDDIALSVEKHGVKRVDVTVHGVCGFCNGLDDKDFYVSKVLEAKRKVEERVPGVAVHAYYISPAMEFEEVMGGGAEGARAAKKAA